MTRKEKYKQLRGEIENNRAVINVMISILSRLEAIEIKLDSVVDHTIDDLEDVYD